MHILQKKKINKRKEKLGVQSEMTESKWIENRHTNILLHFVDAAIKITIPNQSV